MFTQKEASALRQQFWTAFGQYMLPVKGAEGEKVNWVNYRTGEKDVYFRMQADAKMASVSIDVAHKDASLQQIYFEQFVQFRGLLEAETGEEWTWQLHTTDEHSRTISRIANVTTGVNIFRQEDWPALISFFKPRIVALDAFWSQVKYGFETLR
ncbi:MAG: hypothetical protein JWP27_209 [Flaviaesturariibacter sp.]|nr:hypothetical protein [Flaviaesturariibacter sp.]